MSSALISRNLPIPKKILVTPLPLEELFAKQKRRRGGCNENPDLYQFGKQKIFLNVMNSSLLTDLRVNSSTRINNAPALEARDTRQLPKERK